MTTGEVIALIKAFGGSGGGGSSGGGVLVANGTWSDDETTCTLDKTWQEIHDGGFGVVKIQAYGEIWYDPIIGVYPIPSGYAVETIIVGQNGLDTMRFTTNSASGYPAYS